MKKTLCIILSMIFLFSVFTIPVFAEDNDSRYALTISAPKDGGTVDSTESLKIKWKRYSGADHYWLTVKEVRSGDKVFNGAVSGTSKTLKKNFLDPDTEYKLYVAAMDEDDNVLKNGAAWQVIYFETEAEEKAVLVDGYPELMMTHGKYTLISSRNVRYAYVTESVQADAKLKLTWMSPEDFDDYAVTVTRLDQDPDPQKASESGDVLYSKLTSKKYLTVSARYMRESADSWIKVSLQGLYDNGSYSTVTNFYFYVGTRETVVETDPYEISDGNTYAPYTGVDYLSTLKTAYQSGKISKTEYENRISVLTNARKMATLVWTAPVTFNTWRGGEQDLNKNNNMVYSGTSVKPNTFTAFVKGVQYVGIPYSAYSSGSGNDAAACRTAGVTQWLNKIATVTKTSQLQGTAVYRYKGRDVPREDCTVWGIDCSGFVYRAYEDLAKPASSTLWTGEIVASSSWKKLSSKNDLLPGDVLCKSGHVMIFVGFVGENYAVLESTAAGETGCSGCRYYVYSPGDIGDYSPYRYAYIGQ